MLSGSIHTVMAAAGIETAKSLKSHMVLNYIFITIIYLFIYCVQARAYHIDNA
jgi:hypothetical protein